MDNRYLCLVDGWLEYHRPIITNACPHKRSQKSLQAKLVPILPRVSEVRIQIKEKRPSASREGLTRPKSILETTTNRLLLSG